MSRVETRLAGVMHRSMKEVPRPWGGGWQPSSVGSRGGRAVTYSDPHMPAGPAMRHHQDLPPLKGMELMAGFLGEQDCVLIATDHSAFDYAEVVRHSKLVLDTRNATRHATVRPGSRGALLARWE